MGLTQLARVVNLNRLQTVLSHMCDYGLLIVKC